MNAATLAPDPARGAPPSGPRRAPRGWKGLVDFALPSICTAAALGLCVTAGHLQWRHFLHYLTMLLPLGLAIAGLRHWGPGRGMTDAGILLCVFGLGLLPGVYVAVMADHRIVRVVMVAMALAPLAYGVLQYETRQMLGLGAVMLALYGLVISLHRRRQPDAVADPGDVLVGVALAVLVVLLSVLCGHIQRLRERIARRSQALGEALARLSALAERDELTGLFNRRTVMQRLQAAVAAPAPCAVAIIDIDHFKRINDTWGHQVGDEVLRRLARAAQACVGDEPGCAFGRHGGEEFVLVLAGHDAAAAIGPVRRLHAAIAAIDMADVEARLRVTASIGVAVRRPGEAADALLDAADQQLYRAKALGRMRVCERDTA